MPPVSLYIHFPFCIHRCCYCDFNTYTGMAHLIPEYVDALCNEAELISRATQKSYHVETIYLGGGTPSLVHEKFITRLMDKLIEIFHVKHDAEITMEVNPGTVTYDYLSTIFDMGINRLSIGMQSADQFDLMFLERIHDFTEVIQAIKWSRQAGFDNINLDLLIGIPGQSMNRWQSTLKLAMKLKPEHLSVYALTIEDRTPLGRWKRKGLIKIPDPDLTAEMYEWTSKFLSSHGYHQYEISNWARLDGQGEIMWSRHNLQYWRNLPYFGLGAGAHGYLDNKRLVNIRFPRIYIKRLIETNADDFYKHYSRNEPGYQNLPTVVESITIDQATEMSETMMMGLRLLKQGVTRSSFFLRFGVPLEDVYGSEINKLIQLGLLRWSNNKEGILLTERGRLLGNQVFMEFV